MNNDLKQILPEIINIRRTLHENPELSYNEYNTTELIKNSLTKWGLEFHPFENLETGGYCDIGNGHILAFRSDIDALPINENTCHEFCSKNSGIMHACGHDYHTAIGLGLLKYFDNHQSELVGKLRVIFQPAEEADPGGAKIVAEEKIWDNVKEIFTVHVDSELDIGKISVINGISSASSTVINVELNGPGGHTSRPLETVDLIHVTAEFTIQVLTYLRKHIDPIDSFVLAFGQIHGGDYHNVIPQTVTLRGTLRTLDNSILEKLLKLIKHFATCFSKTYGLSIDIKFPNTTPGVVNDDKMYQIFVEYMSKVKNESDLVILQKPSMGADDFSFYLDKVPGLYLQIGGGGNSVAHSGDFNLNENLLKPALNHLVGFISYYLKR